LIKNENNKWHLASIHNHYPVQEERLKHSVILGL
jgi:hypothetical protein